MLALVEANGWGQAHVFFPDGSSVPYSYTVGLCARGLPDLLIVELTVDTAHSIPKNAVDRLLAGEFSGKPHELLHECANLPLAPRLLDPEVGGEHALGAFRYAQSNGHACSIVQMV